MQPHSAIATALARLLKPLARLLLRQGIAYAEFAEFARRAYVEVANEDFVVPGKKQTKSRIAVLTGIHRHEVARLLKPLPQDTNWVDRQNRAARIISAWQNDPEFSHNKQAAVLSVDTEFATLVSRHGGDVTPRAVLDELSRVGAVKQTDNTVTLLVEAFTPLNSFDDLLYIIGDCTADLLETLDYNLSAEDTDRRLQLSVVYDNLPDEVLANLELVSSERAMTFMQELNAFFRTQDRDSNPAVSGAGRNRAGVGLYFFKNKIDDE